MPGAKEPAAPPDWGRAAIRSLIVAVIAVSIATACTWGTALLTGKTIMVYFVVAVLISAGQGIGVGFLTTALGTCAMMAMFRHTMSVEIATSSMIGLFGVVGIVISVVLHDAHLKRVGLERARAALETANHRLLAQAGSLAEANRTLARQKLELALAHAQLRQLGGRLAREVRVPLRTIRVNTAKLAECNETGVRMALWAVSEQIEREVQEVDTLIEDFARAC